MLVDDDKADDTADAEGCEPNVRIQHLNVRDDHAASSASDSNNGVLEIVGVHCYAGSIMIQATDDVSVALDDVIVKLVPAVRVETLTQPGVPPSVLLVRKILLPEPTDVVDTTTDPADRVATPILAFVPSFTLNP